MQSRIRRTRTPETQTTEITNRVRRVRSRIAEPDEATVQTEDVAATAESDSEVADRIEQKYRARADSPLRAIRAFCVLCMGCQPRMVANCSATNCVLYPYRFGKNPHQRHTKRKTVEDGQGDD